MVKKSSGLAHSNSKSLGQYLFQGNLISLGLKPDEKAALVAFMMSLTDERVRFEKAPFDHPSICVTNGHLGDEKVVTEGLPGRATDDVLCLPAVGAAGIAQPIKPFLNLDPFSP